MNSLLNQIKKWRARFEPKAGEDGGENELNKAFAGSFSGIQGHQVLDYLIENYFKPVEFIGAHDHGKLSERNGQQLMMVDILSRIDIGQHPSLYQPTESEIEREMDVRL